MDKEVKIKDIRMNLSHYQGRDLYSDGDVEDIILDAVQRGKEKELLRSSNDFSIFYHLSELRGNLLNWFPFVGDESVLEIGSGCGAITKILSKKCRNVTCVELSKKRSLINAYQNIGQSNIDILVGNFQDIEPELEKYDVITLIGVLEYAASYISSCNPYKKLLDLVKKHLNDNGTLLIAIENKMGLKYWNGAWEDHTGNQYSGLNDYINERYIRTFSRQELSELLESVGFNNALFFYPMPDYKFTDQIYSDFVLPEVGSLRTYRQEYYMPRFYNFNDATVNDQICRDGMFSYFANSFFVSTNGYCNREYVKYSVERKPDFRIATVIEKNDKGKCVKKIPMSPNAQKHILQIYKNQTIWEGVLPNITCTLGSVQDGVYVSEYVDGNSLDELLFGLRHDVNLFIEKIHDVVNAYLKPDDQSLVDFVITDEYKSVFGDEYIEESKSMRVTNIDCIFSNLKKCDDRVFAFDYEWVFDFPIPYEFSLWRAIHILYDQYMVYLKPSISKNEYLRRLGFEDKKQEVFAKMEKNFYLYVCGNHYEYKISDRYIKNAITLSSRIV